jgi:hypothetical protein
LPLKSHICNKEINDISATMNEKIISENNSEVMVNERDVNANELYKPVNSYHQQKPFIY